MSGQARGTALLAGALVLLLAGALFREALFGGQVLSPADCLLRLPPWAADTPRGFVPGNPVLSDQATQFLPWALLEQRQLGAGVPPLWNPYAACGQPLCANMQSAFLSPYALWLWLLPFGAALVAIALSKLLLAGVGTALLARRLGCSPVAACLAGLAFALGGFELLWLGHPHSATCSLLPLLLLLVERWLERGGRGWLPVGWALAVAALVLSGHVETALHVALIVALWAVLRSAGRPWRARLATLAALLGWAVVGALVAGVQWVPFVEYLLHSSAYAQRTGLREEWRALPWELLPWVLLAGALLALAWVLGRRAALAQERGRWARAALAALALVAAGVAALSLLDVCGLSAHYRLLWWPDAWGHPVPARGLPWNGPRAFVNVNGGYASVLVLPLAFVGALCAPRRPALRALCWLWLLGFVLGYEVPFVSHLLNQLPLLNLSLNYRMTLLVGFAGALLAGFGLDALADAASRRRPLGTALLLGAAVAGALALAPHVPWPADWPPARHWADSFPEPPPDQPYVHAPLQARWLLLGAGAALLLLVAAARRSTRPSAALRVAALVLVCADLYAFGRGFNPSAPPDEIYPPTRVTDWLAAQPGSFRIWCVEAGMLPAETASVYGLRDVRGYDALGVERVTLERELLRPVSPDEHSLAPYETLDVAHPLFGLLDVGFVLAPNAWTPPDGAALEKVYEVPSCAVWRCTGWHAPAFVCGEGQDVRPYLEQAVSASSLAPAVALRLVARNLGAELARRWHDLRGPPPLVLLETDVPPPAGAPFEGQVRAVETAELQQQWAVSASAPGWLCVSDAAFPGWRAQVDGVDAPIEPAFFGMRAVRVPEGQSVVTFRYEPGSVKWGLALSALGVLAVGVAAVRRKRAGLGAPRAGMSRS